MFKYYAATLTGYLLGYHARGIIWGIKNRLNPCNSEHLKAPFYADFGLIPWFNYRFISDLTLSILVIRSVFLRNRNPAIISHLRLGKVKWVSFLYQKLTLTDPAASFSSMPDLYL